MTELAGMRTLVTGAEGFIGSHLVERLVDEGASVRALCLYNSDGSRGWLEDLSDEQMRSVDVRLGDIRDPRSIREVVDGVDLIFHLAALIAIPYSYQAPESFIETNVLGTLRLLEAVRDTGSVRLMIHTSTSEVYGTPKTVPIRESHTLRAQSPYAASKIAADQLCEAYARSFKTPVVTLRPFNTFGPRQSARAVIPTILGQLIAGAGAVRLGSLRPRRDFTYVADTVDGFIRMATADLAPGSIVQLGTGHAMSIGELFALCCQVAGVETDVSLQDERVRPSTSEVSVLQSDPTRAMATIGWKPTTTLEDGLSETVLWLRPRVDAVKAARYHT